MKVLLAIGLLLTLAAADPLWIHVNDNEAEDNYDYEKELNILADAAGEI